jgi:hypothetical protein
VRIFGQIDRHECRFLNNLSWLYKFNKVLGKRAIRFGDNHCAAFVKTSIKAAMKKLILFAAALGAFPISAFAEVKNTADNGFVIVHNAQADAAPEEIWKRLISPKDWWLKAHSWSGSADGFYIDAKAGGCFCENFFETQKDSKQKIVGSVEHMRVIFAQPGTVLRMQGALGPLQSEAVNGTFTVAMAANPDGQGTKLSFSYVVGGYMRYKGSEIAPAVDKVVGEQFASLLAPFQKITADSGKPANWSLDIDGLTGDTEDPKAEGDLSSVPAKPAAPKSSTPKAKAPAVDPAAAVKKER